MKTPRYEIVQVSEFYILIRDLGPWDVYPTITNGAEAVVAELASRLNGRRLEYYDSEGECGQLLVRDGAFAGFAQSKLERDADERD